MPLETPIRDIVDRCQVWESHADSDVRRASKPGPDTVFPVYAVSDPDGRVDDLRVVAVATPQSTQDQVEVFFILSAAATPAPCGGSTAIGNFSPKFTFGGHGPSAAVPTGTHSTGLE